MSKHKSLVKSVLQQTTSGCIYQDYGYSVGFSLDEDSMQLKREVELV